MFLKYKIMKYIIVQKDNNEVKLISSDIFNSIDQALEESYDVENSFILPLSTITKFNIISIKEIKQLYTTLCDKLCLEWKYFKNSKQVEYTTARNTLRYFLYEYANLTYSRIAAIEKIIFKKKYAANHDTIAYSVDQVRNKPKDYKELLSFIRSL